MPAVVGMDSHAAEEWRRVVAAMPPDVYTALDVAALTQYALAWSMLIRAQQDLDARGLMIASPLFDREGNEVGDAVEVNPAVKAWKAANEVLIRMADRLGLSPGVRARMSIPGRNAAPTSKFGTLIQQ